jgi:hypothetical protein
MNVAAKPQLSKDSSHLAAVLQLELQKLPCRLRAKPDRCLLGTSLRQALISWIEISQGDREIGSRASFCCSRRAMRCVTVQASNGAARIETLNFLASHGSRSPDLPVESRRLAGSQSRRLAGSSPTRHQDGGSPRRAVRWHRSTTHELLQSGCDLAAKCDELAAACLQRRAVAVVGIAGHAARRLTSAAIAPDRCRKCDDNSTMNSCDG